MTECVYINNHTVNILGELLDTGVTFSPSIWLSWL